MVDREPSTSNSNNLEFDEEFIQRARKLPTNDLEKEVQLLESGDHPLLRTLQKQREREQEKQAARIEEHRKLATEKVEEEYEQKEAEIQREFDARIVKLREEAMARYVEMEKSVTAEYGTVDINKQPTAPVLYDTNKKTLRGRGGGQLIEPANYFNQNLTSKIPEAHLKMAFDEDRIRQELAAIADDSDQRRGPRSNVTITKQKITIDSKSFKQGEEVSVRNSLNEPFDAKIDFANEQLIQFKASKNWDVRQITATVEDLEDGRVIVAKRDSRK